MTAVPLTVSGNEITDATRTANNDGDGRSPESSFGIWESVTNLVPQGSMESGIAGISAAAATLTQDATIFKFGTKSLKVTATGNGAGIGLPNLVTGAPLAAGVYVFSIWVYASGSSVGKTFSLQCNETGGVAAAAVFASATQVLVSGWQRLSCSGAVLRDDRTALQAYASMLGSSNEVFYLDGIQFEKSTVAIPTLTLTGNEITDITRAANLAGDGRAVDSSIGIWPAATNLCNNGGLETNLTGWTLTNGGGGTTATRQTSGAKFGTGCLRLVNTVAGADAFMGFLISGVTSGTTYVVSAWVNCSTFTAAAILNRGILILDNGNATNAAVTLTGATAGWVRLSVSITIGAVSGNTLGVRLYAPQGTTDWDGIQVEVGSTATAPPTPYIQTDGATATRAVSAPSVPVGTLDETQGWVAMRVRMGWGVSQPLLPIQNPCLFSWRDDNTHMLASNFVGGSFTFLRVNVTGPSAAAVTNHVAGDIVTLIFAWSATQVMISLNGAPFVKAANTTIPVLAATSAWVGNFGGANGSFGGDVLWMMTGAGALSDANAATIHGYGNTDPQNLNAVPGSPLLLWKGNTNKYELPSFGALAPTPTIKTDGATATRAASRVTAPVTVVDPAQGWIAVRLRVGANIAAGTSNFVIGRMAGGTGPPFLYFWPNSGSPVLVMQRGATPAGVASIPVSLPVGSLVTAIGAWDATTIKVSLNGAPFVGASSGSLPTGQTSVEFGQNAVGGAYLNGDIFWAATGVGTLSDADAATLNGYGNTGPPSLGALPVGARLLWQADDANAIGPTDVIVPRTGTKLLCSTTVKCSPTHVCGEVLNGDRYYEYPQVLDGANNVQLSLVRNTVVTTDADSLLHLANDTADLQLTVNPSVLVLDTGYLNLPTESDNLKLDTKLSLAGSRALELAGSAVVVNPLLIPEDCDVLDLQPLVCLEA